MLQKKHRGYGKIIILLEEEFFHSTNGYKNGELDLLLLLFSIEVRVLEHSFLHQRLLLERSSLLSYRAEYFNKREQMHSAIYKKLKNNENDKISIKISEN
jgi:hypothetical protein